MLLQFQRGTYLSRRSYLQGDRLVIPKALREDTMQRIHRCHLGVQSCLRRGREVMYWPRMNQEVKKFVSDYGPPYNSKEFAEFSKEYEFQHKTSSPRYPQSNGKAGNAAKIAKNVLQKANYAR